MGGAQKNETQCCRDMVDAIREILGLAPLYRDDSTTQRYVSKQMEMALGDGNNRSSARGGAY